jgi:hypothetical protein
MTTVSEKRFSGSSETPYIRQRNVVSYGEVKSVSEHRTQVTKHFERVELILCETCNLKRLADIKARKFRNSIILLISIAGVIGIILWILVRNGSIKLEGDIFRQPLTTVSAPADAIIGDENQAGTAAEPASPATEPAADIDQRLQRQNLNKADITGPAHSEGVPLQESEPRTDFMSLPAVQTALVESVRSGKPKHWKGKQFAGYVVPALSDQCGGFDNGVIACGDEP